MEIDGVWLLLCVFFLDHVFRGGGGGVEWCGRLLFIFSVDNPERYHLCTSFITVKRTNKTNNM
jgi:hypothetical protein